MSDDLENLLGRLRPRGAPTELRPRILDALANDLPEVKGTPMKWKKRLLYWGATAAALLLIALTADAGWIFTSGNKLDTKLKAIRDAGDPVTLPDLAQPDLAPDDNAAVSLGRAKKDLKAVIGEINKIAEGKDYQAGKLTDDDRKKLKALFEANADLLKLVEKASRCKTYQAQLDYKAKPEELIKASLDDATSFREVVNLLDARSRLQVADGQLHEALQTCVLLLRLSRLYDGRLFLINGLVANAGRAIAVADCNRVLRSGAVTDKDRDELEAELARHDGPEAFVRTLKCERAYGVSSFDSMKGLLNGGFLNDDELYYLDLVQEQIDLAPKSYAEFLKSVKAFQANKGPTTPLANLFFPALQKYREARERERGELRCLRVLNALQKAGVKPEKGEPKLVDLKLPAAATTDPFTDEPLHVKIVDGQWLIYTVGPNLTDDDGDLAGRRDFGVGPLSKPEK